MCVVCLMKRRPPRSTRTDTLFPYTTLVRSYFPGPRKVKEIMQAQRLGRVLNVNYQAGQYLPDWHPWEPIGSYYVSRRETGGGREIVPFELTWLNDLFGSPTPLACVKAKLTDMSADIADIYHCLLAYPQGVLANRSEERRVGKAGVRTFISRWSPQN